MLPEAPKLMQWRFHFEAAAPVRSYVDAFIRHHSVPEYVFVCWIQRVISINSSCPFSFSLFFLRRMSCLLLLAKVYFFSLSQFSTTRRIVQSLLKVFQLHFATPLKVMNIYSQSVSVWYRNTSALTKSVNYVQQATWWGKKIYHMKWNVARGSGYAS